MESDGMRVPITRHDTDGTVIDGTAEREQTHEGSTISDFRDLDGNELSLPPGSSFRVEGFFE